MRNITNLQVLRGIAAASVVYFHIGATPNFGSFGVDIFFVLSGFVMAMIAEQEPQPRDFVMARLCRILPLYWLMTIGLFCLARTVPGVLNAATPNFEQLAKSLLFVPFFRENGDMYPLLGVGWTLNYEMFFYACLFFSILWFRARWLAATAALLVGAHVGLGHVAESRLSNAFFGNSLLWEFLFGILAFKVFKSGRLTALPEWLCVAAGLLAYGVMAAFESRGITVIRAMVFGMPAVVVVLAALQLEGGGDAKIGPFRSCLATIGDASYATYLSHYFVVIGIERVFHTKLGWFDPKSPVGIVAVLAAALVAGQLLYVFVDRPMHGLFKRKLRRKYSGRSDSVIGAMGVCPYDQKSE